MAGVASIAGIADVWHVPAALVYESGELTRWEAFDDPGHASVDPGPLERDQAACAPVGEPSDSPRATAGRAEAPEGGRVIPQGGWRRWRTPVGVGVAVVAIAIAAAFANVALLGSTGEDRLGRLRPVDPALTTPRPATTVPAPAGTTTGADTSTDDSGSSGDHDGGRGRGGDGDGDDD